jgi:hypothetical protein
MFESQAGAFLLDFGSATRWTPSVGGQAITGLMLLDQPEEPMAGGDVQSSQYQVTYETAAWPGLQRGEVLVIQGEGKGYSYKLRHNPRALADAAFSTAQLTKV